MTKQQKHEIEKWVNYWKEKLFLHGWGITVNYCENKKEGSECVAECIPNFIYREAIINIYPHLNEDTGLSIKNTILHEMVHIILDPYKQLFDDLYTGKLVSTREEVSICEATTAWIQQIISNIEK